MRPTLRVSFVTCTVLLAASLGSAQDFPIRNWTVPPLDASLLKQSSDSGIRPFTHTQGDSPTVFVPFGPCRLHDSRVSAGGPGPIPASTTRNYDFVPSGCPFISGLQAAQDVSDPIIAWSLNISVVNTQGAGFIVAYPTGGAFPPVSVLNYTGAPGEVKNNAAIVPVNGAGSFSITPGVSGTDVIIDANGVFLNTLEPGTQLRVVGSPGDGVIRGDNTNTGTVGTGVIGTQAGSGWGVYGQVVGGVNGARGVYGLVTGGGGFTFGVKGQTNSTFLDAAGVKGVGGSGDPLGDTVDCGPCFNAGVRGINDSSTFGVLALTRTGIALRASNLGTTFGTETNVDLGASATTAVSAVGNITKTGTVSFVEPHPTDASKMIQYTSLEGPEAGTYFRGKARFENGLARIDVPEDFRIVTDSEGLSIQVTPIGDMATVAVQSLDLNRIVVRGSRNVEFFYTVNGVRRAARDFKPIVANETFIPEKPGSEMPGVFGTEFRQRMVANGTYRPDGTVNTETAHRLGWEKAWEERTRPQPQPVSDTP